MHSCLSYTVTLTEPPITHDVNLEKTPEGSTLPSQAAVKRAKTQKERKRLAMHTGYAYLCLYKERE